MRLADARVRVALFSRSTEFHWVSRDSISEYDALPENDFFRLLLGRFQVLMNFYRLFCSKHFFRNLFILSVYLQNGNEN